MGRRRAVWLFVVCVGCGTRAPASNAFDAGVADGGALLDAGTPIDGGAIFDGGTILDAGTPDGGGTMDAGVASDAGALDGPCAPGASRPPTDQRRTLQQGTLERTYKLHVPPSYAAAATPLVLNFHGLSSNSAQQEFFSRMTAKADAAGFVLAYPDGTGVPRHWNAGVCCGGADTTDDVAFVSALIDEIARLVCIDRKRVFATGMSNGGFLSHRLACDLSDRIAAVAPVAGVIGVSTCTPTRPMPVLHFHGTADTYVPYNGTSTFPSVQQTISGWAHRNECAGSPVETFRRGDSACESYSACRAGATVTLCTVDGGGHTWPDGADVAFLGHTTHDLSANDAMWEFFVAHPLP